MQYVCEGYAGLRWFHKETRHMYGIQLISQRTYNNGPGADGGLCRSGEGGEESAA